MEGRSEGTFHTWQHISCWDKSLKQKCFTLRSCSTVLAECSDVLLKMSGRLVQFLNMTDLQLRCMLCFLVLQATSIKIFSPVGWMVQLPCKHKYKSLEGITQLSLQWKGPSNELLCHFIKHKAYQNCTPGYSMDYKAGNITLTIAGVQMSDFGTHICSVSKRHEFSDFTVELLLKMESTKTPTKMSTVHSGSPAGCLSFILWSALFLTLCG